MQSNRYACALALAAALAGAGCGGSKAQSLKPTSARAGQPFEGPWAGELDPAEARALLELRARVAAEPGDHESQVALARLEQRAGRPGAALRHLELAQRSVELAPADARALALLYAQRLRERLAAGDGEAYVDARTARLLAPDAASVPAAVRAEAEFLAALAGFRRASRWGQEAALAHLIQARKDAPADPRLAVMEPNTAPLAALGEAGLWLHQGGARRVALDLLERYARRGGREPAMLRALAMELGWWGQDRATIEPALGAALTFDPVSVCLLGRTADEPGCLPWAAAQAEPTVALALFTRAEGLGWRTARSSSAAAWALITLRGHLAGKGPWLAALARRVDLEAAAGAADLPAYARPTVLRALGRREEAARALAEVLSRLGAGAPMEPGAALLVAAELIAQTGAAALPGAVPGADAAALPGAVPGADAAAPPGAPPDVQPAAGTAPALGAAEQLAALVRAAEPLGAHEAWQVLFLAAASRGDEASVAAWLARAPEAAARAVRAQRGDTLLWGEMRPYLEVASAYFRSPALADEYAAELADRAVSIGRHGPVLAMLFAALGDTSRSLAWWERVAQASPRHPGLLFELSMATTAAGDSARGEVHLVAAAGRSGDPGAVHRLAAELLLAMNRPLDAVAAGRRALGLVPRSGQAAVYEVLAAAMTRLGRAGDAASMERARAALWPRAPGSAARAPGLGVVPEPGDLEAALARAEALAGQGDGAGAYALLTRALATAPAASAPDEHLDILVLAARMRLAAPGSAMHTEAARACVLVLLDAAAQGRDAAGPGTSPILRALTQGARARAAAAALAAELQRLPTQARERLFSPGAP